ncbi:Hypothetical predicted protein [Octopus vulgaris]|uniref:Uncharacterized protein n=1 Tax=Octopus vulgaris TaxID=6645 RepID=A0AA36BLK4_OCTVU|nr:Hypothetical predicted protein [Octopus vulgaris]
MMTDTKLQQQMSAEKERWKAVAEQIGEISGKTGFGLFLSIEEAEEVQLYGPSIVNQEALQQIPQKLLLKDLDLLASVDEVKTVIKEMNCGKAPGTVHGTWENLRDYRSYKTLQKSVQ